MILKCTQCSIGKFNLLSSEKSLSFYLGIYNDDNTPVVVNDTPAIIHYSGEESEYDVFKDWEDDMEYVFEKCFNYANGIWSSRDYMGECLTFAKVYEENYENINTNMLAMHKNKIEEQIKRLQKELERTNLVSELSYILNHCLYIKINKIKNSLEYNEKELTQLIEGSEKYEETKNRIENYKKEIEKLENYKIKEEE